MKTKSNRILTWEAHLVHKASTGEVVAFDLLTDLYRPVLQNLAYRMLRNTDDAKDAVQETFVKAFRAIKDFDPQRPIKPWLCRICSNCCVDAVRNRKESSQLELHEYMLEDPSVNLEEQTEEQLSSEAVMEAIGRLPDKYRKILFMRHFKHMDVTEIAAELNKPEGTVKSWLFRARALLKKDLKLALG